MVRWTLLVAALCAARVTALPASTHDPLVVTRDGDESTSPTPAPTPTSTPTPTPTSTPTPTPTSTPTPTTSGPPPPLKVTEMDVRSEVSMRYARTAVVTRVRNPSDGGQEAVFRVLIPETAFISGFQMTLDGITYKAYVKEKEEAKGIYDQAVSQGISAGHVAAKARDSNEFMVNVNVGPNSMGIFNLTYEELLGRRNGVYNHDINMLPGAPVPKLTVTVHVREAQPITALRVPEVRTGNEIDPTETDPSNAIAVIERSEDKREATITFKPDLEEQKRLMQVYEEKSKESQQSSRWYHTEKTQPKGVLGQFVVQYDVERPKNGEILVNDGYFVHFFAPESLPPLTKLVVFVLDTSGSMSDRKIVQLREAMQAILSELHPGDYFSIVEFSSSVKVHELKEADEPAASPPNDFYYTNWNSENSRKVTLLPPSSATKENIDKAKVIVSRLVAVGGTNIASALDVAIDIVRKGVSKPGLAGETGATGHTGHTAAKDAPATETTVVAATTEQTQQDDDDKQELESIIVFLTDGEPTVGETDPKRIINRLSEKNSGPRKASIFCLAFGEDADRSFLRKLSLRNDGFMRHIYEAADAALQLRDFYKQISSPLLDDVTFIYPPDQIAEGSLTKHKFRTYYAGSEVVVAGRVAPGAAELSPRVEGFCGVEDGVGKRRYTVFPRVPVARARDQYLPLERLWVSLTIRQLLDRKDAADGQPAGGGPEAKAKELALKYEVVTPLTSLVVVKPNATNAVDTQSVDEPNRPNYGGPVAAHSFASYPSSLLVGHARPALHSQAFFGAPLPVAHDIVSADYDVDGAEDDGLGDADEHRGPAGVALSAPGAAYFPAAQSIGFPAPPRPGAPAPAAPAPPATTRVPAADHNKTAASPLQPYHLEQFGWTQPLLDANSDALILQVNGTTFNLKLTKDNNAPAEANDAACARAADGGAGICVYLTRCDSARNITQQIYQDIHCAVHASNQGYAGVCCPTAGLVMRSPAP
ncbi:inter alpha-trypsin inhibitor, heavy chain 4-like isoform X2 [Cydia strobilella]|uniref:inter alpha-trypsin inhibitor, heavy chain 4-like isoform X2 n=1 Tax=Cydia strobilella TaxID=1100964 RepID=UPI0030042795